MARERKAAKVGPKTKKTEVPVKDTTVDALIEAAIGPHPEPSDALAAHASPLALLADLPASAGDVPLQVEDVGSTNRAAARKSTKQPVLASAPQASKPRARPRPAPSLSRAVKQGLGRPKSDEEDTSASPELHRKEAGQNEALPREPAATAQQAEGKQAEGKQAIASTPSPKPEQPAEQTRPTKVQAAPAPPAAFPTPPTLDQASQIVGKFIEYSGKMAAAYLRPRETGQIKPSGSEEFGDTLKTMGRVAESWLSNPTKMVQAQTALSAQLFSVWTDTVSRFVGGKETAAGNEPSHRKVDRRFAAPEWRETPLFDFLHQAYLATTDWAKTMVDDAEGVDQATREKASFYLRQISSALSPSNFILTNPELIKETFKENGENLVRGMKMLAEDIEAGRGELKIRQSDPSRFKLGVDMAATPGKVVFRNDLMELLQYAPATEKVLKRPLLIVPPWINKFYVLDLNKEKSFIGWAVAQGLTVFVISWVNPDERHAAKDWDAYMREGIFAALDAIEMAVGEREVSAVGYCVGGTLLAATLAFMAGRNDRRISSATFLTTQVDFEEAGDLKVFADEPQIRVLEQEMASGGYLPGSKMANAFNMLRPDDLIWNYAVSTYLKGKPPAAFDLLAWNADSTRMTAANHAFYLRNCYLENRLAKGEMVIGGERVNLGNVTIPIYDLAAKEDHIAPARSVFRGTKFFGGPVRYVMAGSGHIAGVVNPPAKPKYQYWTDGRMDGRFEEWVSSAKETKGTWWPDWVAWIEAQAPERVPARVPGAGGLPALADAPGDYVRAPS